MLKFLSNEFNVTLFKREVYPICFEVPISLIEGKKLPTFVARLQTDFSCSIRFVPHDQMDVLEYPIKVSSQHESFKTWKISNVLVGIRFRDGDLNGLFFEIIGMNCNNERFVLDSTARMQELKRFIKGDNSLIKMVIIRLGDSPFWYIFVAHSFLETFRADFLEGIVSVEARIVREKKYSCLRGMRLEELYKYELG